MNLLSGDISMFLIEKQVSRRRILYSWSGGGSYWRQDISDIFPAAKDNFMKYECDIQTSKNEGMLPL